MKKYVAYGCLDKEYEPTALMCPYDPNDTEDTSADNENPCYLCKDVDFKIAEYEKREETSDRLYHTKVLAMVAEIDKSNELMQQLKQANEDIEVLKKEVSMFHFAMKHESTWPVGRVKDCACLGSKDGEKFCPCVIQDKAIRKIMG